MKKWGVGMKSDKLSDLIKVLQMVKKDFGDLPVYLSTDSEGNSYGSINGSMSIGTINKGDDGNGDTVAIAIYPWQEGADYTEINK